jgi:flavin-dependent dehydrogenase
MTCQPPIHIIGAGIAGLTLRKCLKNKGILAIIFEKRDAPARHGYGISTRSWPPLLKLLQMDEATFRFEVAVDRENGGSGRMQKSFSLKNDTYFRATCGRFESLLQQGLDIRSDISSSHTCTEASHSKTGNVIVFKDGKRVPSTFTVDTCGVHSPTASQVKVLPYVVFRGN